MNSFPATLHFLPSPRQYQPVSSNGICPGPIKPGQVITLFSSKDKGMITRISLSARLTEPSAFRNLVIRARWDGSEQNAIEAPLGDFFGIGHMDFRGMPKDISLQSQFLVRAPDYGLNAYFPMPFEKGAVIEVVNESEEELGGVLYSFIDAIRFEDEVPDYRFFARWRRESPAARREEPFLILDAKGEGYLLGACYHVQKLDPDDRWTHGGGSAIFIDGDKAPVHVHTTGGENWIAGSGGCFPYQSLYAGCHFADPLPRKKTESGWGQDEGGRWSIYRWYTEAPPYFKDTLRFRFGTLANDVSSTVYWYQKGNAHEYTTLAPASERQYQKACPGKKYLKLNRGKNDIPFATLGLFHKKAAWTPKSPIQLKKTYPTKYPQQFSYGESGTTTWRRYRTDQSFINLSAIYRAKNNARSQYADEAHATQAPSILHMESICYLLFRVKLDKGQKLTCLIGHDGQKFNVWQGSTLKKRFQASQEKHYREESFVIDANKGWNDIVIEVHLAQYDDVLSGWVVSMRMQDDQGKSLPKKCYDSFSNLNEAIKTPQSYTGLWKGMR